MNMEQLLINELKTLQKKYNLIISRDDFFRLKEKTNDISLKVISNKSILEVDYINYTSLIQVEIYLLIFSYFQEQIISFRDNKKEIFKTISSEEVKEVLEDMGFM